VNTGRVSRRRLLAAVGSGVTAATAGCAAVPRADVGPPPLPEAASWVGLTPADADGVRFRFQRPARLAGRPALADRTAVDPVVAEYLDVRPGDVEWVLDYAHAVLRVDHDPTVVRERLARNGIQHRTSYGPFAVHTGSDPDGYRFSGAIGYDGTHAVVARQSADGLELSVDREFAGALDVVHAQVDAGTDAGRRLVDLSEPVATCWRRLAGDGVGLQVRTDPLQTVEVPVLLQGALAFGMGFELGGDRAGLRWAWVYQDADAPDPGAFERWRDERHERYGRRPTVERDGAVVVATLPVPFADVPVLHPGGTGNYV
jgi:hypothetical protein